MTKIRKTSCIFYYAKEAVTILVNKHNCTGTTTKDFYKPDFDVLSKINKIWSMLINKLVKVQVIHIKGHQNKQNTILLYPVVLNVRADTLATNAINQNIILRHLPQFAPAALLMI
jgi:hypothetical protein